MGILKKGKSITKMKLMKNKHRGSKFDDFLEEEGLRAETEAVAIKRVITFRIELEMKKSKLTKSVMAKKCTRAVRHLIDCLTQIMFR